MHADNGSSSSEVFKDHYSTCQIFYSLLYIIINYMDVIGYCVALLLCSELIWLCPVSSTIDSRRMGMGSETSNKFDPSAPRLGL